MEFFTINEPIDVRVILLEIDQEMFVEGHPFGIVDDIIFVCVHDGEEVLAFELSDLFIEEKILDISLVVDAIVFVGRQLSSEMLGCDLFGHVGLRVGMGMGLPIFLLKLFLNFLAECGRE